MVAETYAATPPPSSVLRRAASWRGLGTTPTPRSRRKRRSGAGQAIPVPRNEPSRHWFHERGRCSPGAGPKTPCRSVGGRSPTRTRSPGSSSRPSRHSQQSSYASTPALRSRAFRIRLLVDNWLTQPRPNAPKPDEIATAPKTRNCLICRCKAQRTIGLELLPCRRSRVRVPSAASKNVLQLWRFRAFQLAHAPGWEAVLLAGCQIPRPKAVPRPPRAETKPCCLLQSRHLNLFGRCRETRVDLGSVFVDFVRRLHPPERGLP